MCINKKELDVYNSLNKIASRNSVVLLGSTYAKEIPVSELKQTYGILSDLYNRSLTDLSVFEANDIIIDTINCLKPKKILLQLGETDFESGTVTVDEVIKEIESIVSNIKKADKHTKIILVSLRNLMNKEIENEFNNKLDALTAKTKTTFVDITSATDDDATHTHTFNILKYFMADDYLFTL